MAKRKRALQWNLEEQRVILEVYRKVHLYLSMNWWNFILTGYPDCLILMVSNIPAYLNCSKTTGISNLIGALSLFGLTHLTNHGLQRAIDSNNWCKLSLNLAATANINN